MLTIEEPSRIKGFWFPRSIIGYAVWAYHRFALSLRDVANLLAERGVTVSYETIRDWVNRFGHRFAARVRRDRRAPAGKWHLYEVVIRIKGKTHWLWPAVEGEEEQELIWGINSPTNGDVLDIIVQPRRNQVAARQSLLKLPTRWGPPRILVTDKLRSHGAARVEMAPTPEHRQHKGGNNRSEASHRHARRRETMMGRFKSPKQPQRFLSVHDQTTSVRQANAPLGPLPIFPLRPKHHRLSAKSYRTRETTHSIIGPDILPN